MTKSTEVKLLQICANCAKGRFAIHVGNNMNKLLARHTDCIQTDFEKIADDFAQTAVNGSETTANKVVDVIVAKVDDLEEKLAQ